MELEVLRYNSKSEYTDGLLFIDGSFAAHTLEDEGRTTKVWGETRIPDGTYNIKLRTVGGHHARYLKKFGEDFHKGMLWIQDVPGFEYILIHIGNTTDDTAGCLLVGSTADKNRGFTGNSGNTYKEIYSKVARAIINGDEVTISYKTLA